MGCSFSGKPTEHGDRIEVAQSSSTLLQSLVIDVTSLSIDAATVYSSNTVDDMFKKFQVKPILIKYKPSRGLRLQSAAVVTSSTFLNCIDSAQRFDPDMDRSPMLYSKEMLANLESNGVGDNSVLCLTYLAGSINRIVAKLQRERVLIAIKLTERIEDQPSGIHDVLAKQMESTDRQFERTRETSKLLKVSGSNDRIKKLIQDGIDQYNIVLAKLRDQRKRVLDACATFSRSKNANKDTSVNSAKTPMQSWVYRYHLVCAGKKGYNDLIERLISWVSLAICSVPNTVVSNGNDQQHKITQSSCVLVMAFKEQLGRECTFLLSKSRSLMLEGGNAEKVLAILISTRTAILNAMQRLIAASPSKGYMQAKDPSPMDLVMASEKSLKPVDKQPPIVEMLLKFKELQAVLADEEKTLLESERPHSPSKLPPSDPKAPAIYMEWFEATQQFYDLTEVSLSGIMRHFALSVPADAACFPSDLENTVPAIDNAYMPTLDKATDSTELKSYVPVIPMKLCDLSEGLVGQIMKGLHERRYKRIVALVGAGISVAAGVPDFRSPGGLYDQMRSWGFEHPMQVFTADFLREHPESFYKVFAQLRTDDLNPTLVHYFLRLLYDQGSLLRVYTQNIDAFERKVGVPRDNLIEAHGTMADARCLECGEPCTTDFLWSEWGRGDGTLPRCTSKGCNGLLRPAVVFFGEQLDMRFRTTSSEDLSSADLVLIMGTSLSVEPFASLVQKVPVGTPRLLINRHVPYVMQRRPWELLTPSVLSTRMRPVRKDASILGECDDIIRQVMTELGWERLLRDLHKGKENVSLKDVPGKENVSLKDVPLNEDDYSVTI